MTGMMGMMDLNDRASVEHNIKETQKEIDVISKHGWGTWKSVYHATLKEQHRGSYIATLNAQIEYLANRLKELT